MEGTTDRMPFDGGIAQGGYLTSHADGARPKPPEVEWHLDPTDLALEASAWRQKLPDAFCAEVGRRMLLAELEFSEWVLRRVEKVRFDSDRSVSRRSSIELNVRDDAPVFVDRGGSRYWLVPLSMMRRRTLVNLDLRDERNESIMMPGLRLAQQLDESILLAAAATSSPSLTAAGSELRGFVRSVIAGEKQQLIDCMYTFERRDGRPRPAYLSELADNPVFTNALYRLSRNFTLYVFLPLRAGRHRLLRMSFDEPTDWAYQVPSLERQPDGYRYEPGVKPVPWYERSHLAAAFGLSPTRIRFQVPAAENAASYHFEVTAPDGVQIVEASLLAGRPNDSKRHVSADHVGGHSPTVGLHAVEIPNGSLCRAQVDLGIPTRGWLTTMLTACWLIFAVLLSVAYHWLPAALDWSSDQVTNVVVLLISTSAGVATLVAQRDVGGVGARLVIRMRAIGAAATALPVIAAGLLTYGNLGASDAQLTADRRPIFALTGCSLLAALLISMAWLRSRLDERRKEVQRSPWDMTDDACRPVIRDYLDALREYQFDSAAVGIRSAEGWHERYAWDDETQKAAVAALQPTDERTDGDAAMPTCLDLDTACALRAGCAARRAATNA